MEEHGQKLTVIQQPESVSAALNSSHPQSKVGKSSTISTKSVQSKQSKKNKKDKSAVPPILGATSKYHKSISQMYKNLEALRKKDNKDYSKDGADEDPYLPYVTPFAPKVPVKVQMDLQKSHQVSHPLQNTPSVMHHSAAQGNDDNGFIVAAGVVGEDDR